MVSIAGRTAQALFDTARTERDAGHVFNAALLSSLTAAALAARGPYLELDFFVQTARENWKTFVVPPELSGAPPFSWTMNGKTAAVSGVSLLGVGGEIGLVFELPQPDWPGDADVDRHNREFLDDFRAAHPEYASAFQFLLARAHKPDNSGGVATAYENGKGYQ